MNRVINSTYFPPGMHNTSTQRDLEAGIVHNAAGNHYYNADIDVDLINRSLAHVNNFAKRHTEKLPQVLMYEINATGDSCYKTITLRELLQYVNDETEPTTPESDHMPIPEMSSNRVLPPTGLKSYSTGTGTSSKQGGLRRSGSSSANLNQKEYSREREAGGRETPRQRQVEEHREQEPIAGRYARSDFESVFDDAYNVIGELRLRDLRRLDFQFNPNEERSVLIRRHSVLFAMDPIRAVVMADRLILIVPDGADSLLSILDKYMKEWVLAKRAIEELNAEDTPYPGYNNNTNNTIHAQHRFSDLAHNTNNTTVKFPGISNTNYTNQDSSGSNTDTNTNTLGTLDDSAKLAHLLTTYNQTNTTNTTTTANAAATTTTPATLFDNPTIHPLHTPHNTPHTTTYTSHNYGAIPITTSGASSTNSSTSTTGSATYMLSPSTAPSTVNSSPYITSPLPPLPGQSSAGSAKGDGVGSGIGSGVGTGMGSGGVNSDFIDLESSTHALLTPSPPTCTSPPSKHQIQMLRKAISAAHELPFEVHAYEALLTTVMVLETQEFNRVNAQVQVILGYFRSGSLLPIEVQEQMRNRKNDLCVMLGRITSARNTINELTEDDEDMALMNLTLLKKKPKLYFHPLVPAILARHDEIEELLESYLIDFNALESKIEYVRSQIQNAEELLSLRLDTSRNELLIANTVLAILACCFGLGAYVSGIFGMNLDNTGKLQETKGVFNIVIAASTGAMILLFLGMVVVFKRNGMFPRRLALLDKDAAKFQ